VLTFTDPVVCGEYVSKLRKMPANKHYAFVPKRLFEERGTWVIFKYLKFEDPHSPNELGQIIVEIL
jgi:hypothetical protein